MVGLDGGQRPGWSFPCISPLKSLGLSFPIWMAPGGWAGAFSLPASPEHGDRLRELVGKNTGS